MAGETVKVPVYLPPPALASVPMRAPVPAFHTVSEAAVLVLEASTFNWKERSVSSAFVIRTESRGWSTVTPAVWDVPASEAVMETAVSVATGCSAIGKLALVAPAGTVTLAGTEASAGFDAERLTIAPESDGPLTVTVP